MTEKERILTVLKTGRVVTQTDFDEPTIDGLSKIRQIARRVHDLRKEGYDIPSVKTPADAHGYKLLSSPSEQSGTVPPAAPPENGRVDGGNGTVPEAAVISLFGSEASRNAIYGEAA